MVAPTWPWCTVPVGTVTLSSTLVHSGAGSAGCTQGVVKGVHSPGAAGGVTPLVDAETEQPPSATTNAPQTSRRRTAPSSHTHGETRPAGWAGCQAQASRTETL